MSDKILVNGYSGEYFDVWFPSGTLTRTDTIPIWLQLVQEDGVTPIGDVAGDKLVISFGSDAACLLSGDLLLEAEILPATPTADAIFSGEISDTQTLAMESGVVYASVAHIKADGRKYILDMARINIACDVSRRIA